MREEEKLAFKLVPVEPTKEMLDAAQTSLSEWRASLSRDEALARSYMPPHGPRKFVASASPAEKHAIRYRAMIAAAPQPDGVDVGKLVEALRQELEGVTDYIADAVPTALRDRFSNHVLQAAALLALQPRSEGEK